MQNERYFSHSWALLTRDKGWYKPLLVMTAASFVPVAGALGNKGYAMEYARLTAWGVDASPKQKNVDVVKCISSGWRGFVVDLGVWILFGLAFGLISTVFAFVPGPLGRGLGILWSLISWAIAVLVGVGLYVAEIRAAIYEKISAGFRLGHIFEMIRRDFGGFAKVFLINLACSAITVLCTMVYMITITPLLMPTFMRATAMSVGRSSYEGTMGILSSLSSVLVPIFVLTALFGFVLSFIVFGSRIITMNAAGLWMRQFDVPNWGRSEEPLPVQERADGAQGWQRPPEARQSQTSTSQSVRGEQGVQQSTQTQDERGDSRAIPRVQAERPVQVEHPSQRTDFVKTQPLVTPEPEVRPVSEPADAGTRLDTVTPADVTAESVDVTSELAHSSSEPVDGSPQPAPTRWWENPTTSSVVDPMTTPEPMAMPEPVPMPDPVSLADFAPSHTERPESKVTARDAFWRDAVEDVHGGQNSSTNTISADDTASLKRVDTTGEETTTIE